LPIGIEDAKNILQSNQIEKEAYNLIERGPEERKWPSYTSERFARALAHHAKDTKFSIRSLQPGKSAIVVLIRPDDLTQKPGVLKFGETKDILQEERNYARLKSLDTITPGQPALSPADYDSPPLEGHGFCSLYYEWAGAYTDVDTFGKALTAPNPDMRRILDALDKLLTELWRWYEVQPQGKIPEFDYRDKKDRILSQLASPQVQALGLPREVRDLVVGWNWQLRLNASSVASITHGDLNAGNILLTKDPLVRPLLIDFQNLKEFACPARDWAKLERELKFVWFPYALGEQRRGNFTKELQRLNSSIEHDGGFGELTQRFAQTIQVIRQKYFDMAPTDVREAHMAPVEYFFNLACWEVEYLSKKEFEQSNSGFKGAVLQSTKHTTRLLESAVVQSKASRFSSTVRRVKRVPVIANVEHIKPIASSLSRYLTTLTAGFLALAILPWLFAKTYPEGLFRLHSRQSDVYERANSIVHTFAPPGDMQLATSVWLPTMNEYAAYVLRDGIQRARNQFNSSGKGWYIYGERTGGEADTWTLLRMMFQGPSANDFWAVFDENGELQHVFINHGSLPNHNITGEGQLITVGTQAAEKLFGLPLSQRTPIVSYESNANDRILVLKWHLPPKARDISSNLFIKVTMTGQITEAGYSDEPQLVNSAPYETEGYTSAVSVISGLADLLLIGFGVFLFLRHRPAVWRQGLFASLFLTVCLSVVNIVGFAANGAMDLNSGMLGSVFFWLGLICGLLVSWICTYAILAVSLFYASRELPSQVVSLQHVLFRGTGFNAALELLVGVAAGGLYILAYTLLGFLLGAIKLAAFSHFDFIVGDVNVTLARQIVFPASSMLLAFAAVALPMSLAAKAISKKAVLGLIGTLAFVVMAPMSSTLNVQPFMAYLVMQTAEGAIVSLIFLRYGALTLIAFLVTRIGYAGALTVFASLKEASSATVLGFLPVALILVVCIILLCRRTSDRRTEEGALSAGA
jgi:hypothetical protein